MGVSVGEHYAPTENKYDRGTYRVVGVDEKIVILRAEEKGSRVHTGEVITVTKKRNF